MFSIGLFQRHVILGIEIDVILPRLPDGQHLAWIVPFVERRGGVDPLVALQPDDAAAKGWEMLIAALSHFAPPPI